MISEHNAPFNPFLDTSQPHNSQEPDRPENTVQEALSVEFDRLSFGKEDAQDKEDDEQGISESQGGR